jgi:transcriptional repressor NrdR
VRCSQCQSCNIKVIESREVNDDSAIRRRRRCLDCGFRFTTYERIEKPQLIVIKNNQTRELFDRNKLLNGLFRACEKTPVTSLELERLVNQVESRLYNLGEHEVKSSDIGEIVMSLLADLNEVAYVRFASVYRRFSNIDGFEKELSVMKARQN